MEPNGDVVKKALAVALAKSGHKDVDSFLKTKGVEPEAPGKIVDKSSERTSERKYCDRTCQRGTILASTSLSAKEEKKRLVPIWPIEPETIAEWKVNAGRLQKEAEAFLKSIDAPEHLAKIRAAASNAAVRIPTRAISSTAKKAGAKAEAREAKAAEPKKESRQTRLGQTKLIDELLRAGKTAEEIMKEVAIKIPLYPKDKLPKLIKLRQYHVKK